MRSTLCQLQSGARATRGPLFTLSPRRVFIRRREFDARGAVRQGRECARVSPRADPVHLWHRIIRARVRTKAALSVGIRRAHRAHHVITPNPFLVTLALVALEPRFDDDAAHELVLLFDLVEMLDFARRVPAEELDAQ